MSSNSSNRPPMVVYPHSISQHNPSTGSKGSFGPVFVVLAVVAVLTAMACLVGQICARRYLRPRHRRDHAPYQSDGDLEAIGGIQMRASSSSAAAAGHSGGAKHGKIAGGTKQDDNNPPPVAAGDRGN